MPKIMSKALQVRLKYQMEQGRKVSLSEVAEKAGVARNALTRLEQGETERFDGEFIAKLCVFYGVKIEDLLEIDPSILMPGYVASALATT